jgi:hypothetical protein
MDLTDRWPQLANLVEQAAQIGGLQLWAFGSMLQVPEPNDLDVAVIYNDRARLLDLRSRVPWELTAPPIDLIGLTPDEDADLAFLDGVQAIQLA